MNIEKIKSYFDRAGIRASDVQLGRFLLYYDLIIENNDDNDLTRIKGEDQFIIKHFIDSVYYTRFVELPKSLIDIGTGAGFPGIPIKIMFPEIKLVLAEQRKRRIEFLKLAVKRLGLKNVEFYPHKVTEKSFFDVDGVVTRALEDAPETLSRVEHFLPLGGTVTLLKGPDVDGDLKALTGENLNSFVLDIDREYRLPGTEFDRRILQFKKIVSSFKRVYKIMKIESETVGIPIVSQENKTFRELKKCILEDSSGKSKKIVISGKKIISEYLDKFGTGNVKLLLPDDYCERDISFNGIIEKLNSEGALFILKKSLFNEVDIARGRNPFLIADIPEIGQWSGDMIPGCNPVIPFQDPLNVGAAVRSALAFGIRRVILLQNAANPFNPKAIRSSAGTVFQMEFLRGPSLEDLLNSFPENSEFYYSLDSSGENVSSIDLPESFFVIPGLEGPGLPPELKERSCSIPIESDVESLNAATALSIFFFEWRRRLKTY